MILRPSVGVRILGKHLCFLKPVMYYRQVIRLCIFLGVVYAAFLELSKRVLYLMKLTKGAIVISSTVWGEHLAVLGVSELEQGDGALVTGV